mgnify:FL=1
MDNSSYKTLCRTAKIACDEASPTDYEWDGYEYDEQADAILMLCKGRFGQGTEAFVEIKDSLKEMFAVVDIRINDWCVDCCPIASECLIETRQHLLDEIRKDK